MEYLDRSIYSSWNYEKLNSHATFERFRRFGLKYVFTKKMIISRINFSPCVDVCLYRSCKCDLMLKAVMNGMRAALFRLTACELAAY